MKGSLKLTKSSSTLGTLSYMSPEQINSSKVDARSDIFSFGVVLFEMLTGKMPFVGDYEAAIMYSILNEEPDPLQKHLPEAPSELVHIFNRVLEKDPEDRYQSMSDLVSELRRLQKHASGVSGIKTVSTMQTADSAVTRESPGDAKAGGRSKTGILTMGAIGLAALIALFIYLQKDTDPKPIRLANPQKITQAIGKEHQQTWSPDGSRIAYIVKDSNRVSKAEIYSFSTHEKRRVALPGTEFERINLSWSPHGDYFAYADAITTYGLLRTVRLADGSSFQITPEDRSVRSIQWSADGRYLYFSSTRGGTRDLWHVKLNTQGDVGGKPEQVTAALGMEDFAFSPDHKKIAYSRGETSSNVWRAAFPKPDAPATQWTSAKQLTFESSAVRDLDLSPDGKRIYFASTRSGNRDIWSMAEMVTGRPDVGIRSSG